jgi:hypothetical protein
MNHEKAEKKVQRLTFEQEKILYHDHGAELKFNQLFINESQDLRIIKKDIE